MGINTSPLRETESWDFTAQSLGLPTVLHPSAPAPTLYLFHDFRQADEMSASGSSSIA